MATGTDGQPTATSLSRAACHDLFSALCFLQRHHEGALWQGTVMWRLIANCTVQTGAGFLLLAVQSSAGLKLGRLDCIPIHPVQKWPAPLWCPVRGYRIECLGLGNCQASARFLPHSGRELELRRGSWWSYPHPFPSGLACRRPPPPPRRPLPTAPCSEQGGLPFATSAREPGATGSRSRAVGLR